MALFFVRVLQEFGGNAFSIDAGGHEIMPFVSKHADQLGGERFIQDSDRCPQISGITFSNGSVFNVLTCAFAQSFNVSEKWFIRHGTHSLNQILGVQGYYSAMGGVASGEVGRKRTFSFDISQLSFGYRCKLD